MGNRKTNSSTLKISLIAILTAIIGVMAFTPVGYLKLGVVSITFLPIPVVIGAVLFGAGGGAYFGFLFGLTSFIQCFGMDAFGTTLFNISPFFTAVLCFVPRILMGVLCALIYKGMQKAVKKDIPSFIAASFAGGFLNTVLFVGTLLLLFGKTDYVQSFGDGLLDIVAVFITSNALIEWAVSLVLGTVIARSLMPVIKKIRV